MKKYFEQMRYYTVGDKPLSPRGFLAPTPTLLWVLRRANIYELRGNNVTTLPWVSPHQSLYDLSPAVLRGWVERGAVVVVPNVDWSFSYF